MLAGVPRSMWSAPDMIAQNTGHRRAVSNISGKILTRKFIYDNPTAVRSDSLLISSIKYLLINNSISFEPDVRFRNTSSTSMKTMGGRYIGNTDRGLIC